MLDQPSVPQSSQFSLSESDIERRKVIADVTAEDISHKLTLKDIFTQESDR